MTDRLAAPTARARQELDVGALLQRAGYHEQAASRAYYAAFYAAEAALLLLGESRSKHSGVISAFGRLVVKQRQFDPELGTALRVLFDLRNAADYEWLDGPASAEEDPVTLAARFVHSVERWIEENRSR